MLRMKRYDRATLMRLLEQRCPEALAKIPPPEVFRFRRHGLRDEIISLKIGVFWSSEGDSRLHAYLSWNGKGKPHIPRGNGYSYSTPSVLFENSFFNKLADWKFPDVSSDVVAALVAFVFVYCRQREEFLDFQNNTGLSCLVSALQEISSRIPDGERIEKIGFGNHGDRRAELEGATFAGHEKIDSALKPAAGIDVETAAAADREGGDRSKRFVPQSEIPGPTASSNKLPLDHEDDNTTAVKKHRIC